MIRTTLAGLARRGPWGLAGMLALVAAVEGLIGLRSIALYDVDEWAFRFTARAASKSVHDASWSTLVRLLQEKALRCHRTVVKVSRWFPSSRLCSVCGFNSGKKPLAVRSWTCTACGITHDRDLNAARNILVEGRMVAAGLAETLNARGGGIRLGLVPAAACETRTHQGAA